MGLRGPPLLLKISVRPSCPPPFISFQTPSSFCFCELVIYPLKPWRLWRMGREGVRPGRTVAGCKLLETPPPLATRWKTFTAWRARLVPQGGKWFCCFPAWKTCTVCATTTGTQNKNVSVPWPTDLSVCFLSLGRSLKDPSNGQKET